MTIPLPEPVLTQVETYSGIAINKVVETPLYTDEQMLAYGADRAAEAVKAERERCARVCDEIAIDATSAERRRWLTPLGEAIFEGMYGGAINCAAAIRRGE